VKYCVALALTTMPEDSGNMDPVSKFVQVRTAPAAVALKVFSVGNIVGCAHVIPEIAVSSTTGDGQKEQWIVNSHIDPATQNDLYNWSREHCMSQAGRRNTRRHFLSVPHCMAIPGQVRAQ